MVVGTDVPGLSASAIRAAEELLDSFDVVFGPAEDGGFYLVATKCALAEVFRGVQWSTDTVLRECRRRAAALGLSVAPEGAMPTLMDIDTIQVCAQPLALRRRRRPRTSIRKCSRRVARFRFSHLQLAQAQMRQLRPRICRFHVTPKSHPLGRRIMPGMLTHALYCRT